MFSPNDQIVHVVHCRSAKHDKITHIEIWMTDLPPEDFGQA